MIPHRRGRGPQQEPQVAPVDRQVLELQDRASCEQAVEVFRFEPDRRQRHARLNATLQLQQLDLEVRGGGKIRLILFEPPQLDNFARFRAAGRRRRWRRQRFGHARILAELDWRHPT